MTIDFDCSVLYTIPEDVSLSDLINYLQELDPLSFIMNKLEILCCNFFLY